MSQHRISGLADPIKYDDTVIKFCLAAKVQGIIDTISEMQPVKNIVEAYNKIFGVIDNHMLLLKYELQSGGWKEVRRNSILTNVFEPSTIDTIEYTLYAIKMPERFAVEYNAINSFYEFKRLGNCRLFLWIYPGAPSRCDEICAFRDKMGYY